ncbi:murein hydrolase activator EnvC family protein [Streptomyces sp. NPDC058691]|uniref:murein hydrolase activator EnvC family protein n=1 Tax=Streptomyces sp. NPDC058691 TaxID=3346601 RepID=UPI0036558733
MTRSTVFVVTVYLAVATWLVGLSGPADAVARRDDQGGGATGRAWPVAAADGARRPVVERGFEPPLVRWGAGHRGVDLRAGPGAPVRAAAPGRVAYAGSVAGRGVVVIGLAQGLRITYQPVRATVTVGEEVRAGQVVGVLAEGPWHCPGGCLHWGLLRGKVYLDPLSLLPDAMLRGGPSRLLPVFGVPLPDGTDRTEGIEGTERTEGTAPALSRAPRAGPW